MNTKLVCWTGIDGKDYEFEVPEKAKWMAWDEDGELCWYSMKPKTNRNNRYWFDGHVNVGYGISPPEHGEWYDQLYWIGDE